MTKKVFNSILTVALSVLLASFIIIMSTLYHYFSAAQQAQLKSQLDFAVTAVENEGISYVNSLDNSDYRLTLIDKDGKVLADTKSNPSEMENHNNREEFKQALKDGYGEASRFSKTLTEETIYIAKKLSDGTILRISASHFTVITLFMGMLQPICTVLLISIVLSVLLAVRLSKKIVEPLNNLSFENPLDNDVYEELSPMLRHINTQNKQIKHQLEELKQKQNEFDAITENMNEGLVLLNKKGIIVSINSSAKRLFSINDDCIGKDFLTVDRTPEINHCIQNTEQGSDSEIYVNRNEKAYLFRFSRIEKDNKNFIGTVILIIDVTEKMNAEQIRREFTANVSHELKTPLQSIIGSAELIENGLVKSEDMSRFVSHIKDEASRLVVLINDIIRLSRLDENEELPKEKVNIYNVAEEILKTLKPIADKRNIKLSLKGKSLEFDSSYQLIYEIIYNICDNAVKYNKDGGKVNVLVTSENNQIKITVEDTGIGIAPADRERIFERFYRVDKSHSKETGGTGLGLSIVKHAVKYLNGQISLTSNIGEGTKITVTFNKTK